MRYMPYFLYTTHLLQPLSQNCSLAKRILMVFKIEGIVALTIKGRYLRKYKGESCQSCM